MLDLPNTEIEYINISNTSESTLGRLLDPTYLKVFEYPVIGKFTSAQAMWAWLQCDRDVLKVRRMVGKELRLYCAENCLHMVRVPNLKAIMGYATWIKVKGYPDVIKYIKEELGDKPFVSYYTANKNQAKVDHNYKFMITSIASIIVQAVRDDVEPDFTPLMNTPGCMGEYYLDEFLKTRAK